MSAKVKNMKTRREFLNAILKGEINDEVIAFATLELEKLDSRKGKMSAKDLAKKQANIELGNSIVETLGDEPKIAREIADEFEISVSKVGAVLKGRDDVKVTQVIYNGRVVKGYSKGE